MRVTATKIKSGPYAGRYKLFHQGTQDEVYPETMNQPAKTFETAQQARKYYEQEEAQRARVRLFDWKEQHDDLPTLQRVISITCNRLRAALRKKRPFDVLLIHQITEAKDYILSEEAEESEEYQTPSPLNLETYKAIYLNLYKILQNNLHNTMLLFGEDQKLFPLQRFHLYLSNRPSWFGAKDDFFHHELTDTEVRLLLGDNKRFKILWTTTNPLDPMEWSKPANPDRMKTYELRKVFPSTLSGLVLLADYLRDTFFHWLVFKEGEPDKITDFLARLIKRFDRLALEPAKRYRACNDLYMMIVKAFDELGIRSPVIIPPTKADPDQSLTAMNAMPFVAVILEELLNSWRSRKRP